MLFRLQVHFLAGRPAADESGVRLSLTSDHMPFSAGMLMYASSFSIPPGRSSTLVPNGCCLRGFEPAHGFAFRVHTHALGRGIFACSKTADARQSGFNVRLQQKACECTGEHSRRKRCIKPMCMHRRVQAAQVCSRLCISDADSL